jgi:hypothetical protein
VATSSLSPSSSCPGSSCKQCALEFFKRYIHPTPLDRSGIPESNLLAFYSYLINKPKEKRSLTVELIAATFGSIFAGFGMIFFIMWTGIFL